MSDPSSEKTSIPNRIIFIWLGKKLPFSAGIAIASAASCCKPDEIILYHENLDVSDELVKDLVERSGLKIVSISPDIFKTLPSDGNFIYNLYLNKTSTPATRTNIVRLALLWNYGGIYLDTDTITVKDMKLLRVSSFCGTERVVLPAPLFKSLNPWHWVRAGLLLLARELCTRSYRGLLVFKKIESWYPQAVNNAVIGSAPGHPLLAKAFTYILDMSARERRKRFRMGTHLLQNITGNKSSQDVQVYESEYFYPLGPEVSAHYFRRNSAGYLEKLVGKNTYVVHWYNSVEARFLKQEISLDYMKKNTGTAFVRLAQGYYRI